jgi:hypothetical protein
VLRVIYTQKLSSTFTTLLTSILIDFTSFSSVASADAIFRSKLRPLPTQPSQDPLNPTQDPIPKHHLAHPHPMDATTVKENEQ